MYNVKCKIAEPSRTKIILHFQFSILHSSGPVSSFATYVATEDEVKDQSVSPFDGQNRANYTKFHHSKQAGEAEKMKEWNQDYGADEILLQLWHESPSAHIMRLWCGRILESLRLGLLPCRRHLEIGRQGAQAGGDGLGHAQMPQAVRMKVVLPRRPAIAEVLGVGRVVGE